MATKKQLENRARFKKVMAEAKKLRAKKKNLSQADAVKQAWKNIGAIKIIEKGESKNTKPKATYQYKRSAKGTFKGLKKVGAVKLSNDEKNFIKTESKNAKGYTYRAKILFGAPVVLKEKNNTPIQKWTFFNYEIAKEIAEKLNNKIGATGSHKDTKSHNVNIRVVSGIKRKNKGIGAMPGYNDEIAAREIQLTIDNEFQLYPMRLIILKNLLKKYRKGIYSIEKSAIAWKPYIEAGMKIYHKRFGTPGMKWNTLLSVGDRKLLAMEYAKETLNAFQSGEIDENYF